MTTKAAARRPPPAPPTKYTGTGSTIGYPLRTVADIRFLSLKVSFPSAVEKDAPFDCYVQIDDAEAQKTG
eukprot:CAMPEP_0119353850 /NCGR_PEP_ID=MMETSP1334-20130426/2950_1 /TAXON_ID=127549 /ORGANISM="Calcidiscus leptoporus, Strain RCC1130" /LENGTH=69 /DNA_ID=CAMNT_0007367239 /DNA_START=103 /DNA_END=309 /DNA_ORIENTATION=+